MIDHITLRVSDLAASTAFYEAVLSPLGYTNGGTNDGAVQFTHPNENRGDLWIYQDAKPTQNAHIALHAADKQAVDAFHAAGLSAGARDNGAPGVREEYAPNYYGGFLMDPDGNNIEAVAFVEQKNDAYFPAGLLN